MTERGAFSPEAACHFRDEIDVFVRERTGHAVSPNIRLSEYFRDTAGRLPILYDMLIRSDQGSGKFYLATG